ncbi:MAG: OB-fold domain-containing protein [Clostridia bacterium]|nr:OB-fold domain-containing protein [Clostridia bacterium]MBC7346608.1 OB-fold domain-containing protein [Clostridia bacterium]
MGFEKFGRVSFTAQTKVAGFVEQLEKGEVAASRCTRCGARYFPPRADCYQCLGGEVVFEPVRGTGRLISFTTANYAPTGFEADVPYTLALADFDGLKVFGRMSREVPPQELAVGLAVNLAVVRLPDGQLTYEFIKA